MLNHLEDIKCQEAEERKKSLAIFNGSFIALNFVLQFLLPLVRKKDSEIVLLVTLSFVSIF